LVRGWKHLSRRCWAEGGRARKPMSVQDEDDGPTLASAMRQAAFSTYWAAVSAFIGSQGDMGCAHPGRGSDEDEYSEAGSEGWTRGDAAQRDANGAAGAPGDGAHLVAAGAGSRPGSGDSAHLLSGAAPRPPGPTPEEAAEVGPQVDGEPLVPGAPRPCQRTGLAARGVHASERSALQAPASPVRS